MRNSGLAGFRGLYNGKKCQEVRSFRHHSKGDSQIADHVTVIRRLDGGSHRARTVSQLYRLGQWTGPQSSDAPSENDDTISHYSSSDYMMGDLTPTASDEIVEQYDYSKSELSCDTERYEMPANYAPNYQRAIYEKPNHEGPNHETPNYYELP